MSHLYIHTHTHTHTHTHKHTNTQTRPLAHAQFKFINENIRSNKDSRQIDRNKLKYLHYLNKMIEKCEMKKFNFSKFHASNQNYVKGFI